MTKKDPKLYLQDILSTRNKVLHEYFGVDMEILWQTIQEDIPNLKKQFTNIPVEP